MSIGSGAGPLLDLDLSTLRVIKRVAVCLALGGVLLSYLGSHYAWLDYKPGGAAFDVAIRPVFTGAFVIALVVALRWQLLGGIMATFIGSALIAFAVNQLVPIHAFAVLAALAVPAALWILIDLAELSRTRALIGLALAVVAAVVGFLVGHGVYLQTWGPTHPESVVAALPPSEIEWAWVGRVTTTEAEVRARPALEFTQARLAVSTSDKIGNPTWVAPSDRSGRVLGFDIELLEPDTEYFYAVELDGVLDITRRGTFRTFPTGAASYTVAIGSCARVGSNGQVFDRIAELDPLFYLIAGDLHYGDNGRNDVTRYQEVMDLTLALPAQSALYRTTPIAYMWDDHDYGGNDADGSSPSREAAMAAYREYVPSYELFDEQSAVYQAFTVGRVRYILTDARSARNLDNDDNSDAPSMLGPEQKGWLKNELVRASQSHELVVWLNPVPWIADAADGADHWGGYAAERRELANYIAENDIDNLLMISGDAHMVAIDDGSNTNYSDEPGPGFPLLHAAALDRPGSTKGGPYSEGSVAGGGQFATLQITDNGEFIDVTMSGRNWQGETLMSYTFSTKSDA